MLIKQSKYFNLDLANFTILFTSVSLLRSPLIKYTFVLFTMNGIFSALASIFLSGRLSSVRPNIAFGWELQIITMVVLGGVYIYGGSGSILGVFISIIILGMLSFGLGLLNVPGVGIIIFTGLLLIISIGLPSFIKYFRNQNE